MSRGCGLSAAVSNCGENYGTCACFYDLCNIGYNNGYNYRTIDFDGFSLGLNKDLWTTAPTTDKGAMLKNDDYKFFRILDPLSLVYIMARFIVLNPGNLPCLQLG